ncbi:Mu transposase domain-containing protein [Xylanimonas allomyrinae]|uniref:Mu transposase domain-containing protein n=1 Tax=Xylanimonas allomyrinae TaxID=2509459 RepID=UPI001B86046F|nr:DDE-type integrase/transposase/recombinase [Xylanimonas allomyrinae]
MGHDPQVGQSPDQDTEVGQSGAGRLLVRTSHCNDTQSRGQRSVESHTGRTASTTLTSRSQISHRDTHSDLWFPPRKIPLEDGSMTLLPVLVLTCAYSRFMLATMIPTRHTQDLLLGMWVLLQQLGRVPRRLIWDNESGIGRGKRHAEGVAAFTGTLATTLLRLKPYDPQSKGVVERRNGFFETSFMPGRDFASPGDFNDQFADWLTGANARIVRTIRTRPLDLLEADKAAMLPLPPVAPAVGWVNRIRLGNDYYVRAGTNDYSVDPAMIGRFVDVHADLARVEVRHAGRVVAAHDRVWARGMTITDPAHVATAKMLRERFQAPRPAQAESMVRDLGEYDRAFGIITGEVAV